MKLRTDFVSNSSSSSFIVNIKALISNGEIESAKEQLLSNVSNDGILTLPSCDGDYEFGWECKEYSDIISKINFVALQIITLIGSREEFQKKVGYNPECVLDKFKDFLKRTFGIEEISFDENRGYIDHQSSIIEFENTSCLDDIEAFVLTQSYIQGGNDNDWLGE